MPNECSLAFAIRQLDRCCSVTRRRGCANWNQDAIGAFTAAAWFGDRLVDTVMPIKPSLWPSVSSVSSVLIRTVESTNVGRLPDVPFAQTRSTGQFLNTELTEDTEGHREYRILERSFTERAVFFADGAARGDCVAL